MPSCRNVTSRAVGLGLAAALLLTGCTDEEPGTPTAAPSSSAATAPPDSDTSTATAAPTPTTPAVTVAKGLDKDLGKLARALYGGGKVSLDKPVAAVLGPKLRAQDTEVKRTVKGAAGTWKGTRIAVLTSKDDVTLAVRRSGTWRVVGGWWPSLGVTKAVPRDPRIVLLAGSDARPGERRDRSRADALQLVGTDGRTGGGVVGIARDSWVPVPGYGSAKINAAMAWGGPDLLRRTVEQATGLDLLGYIVVDFDGFKALVEELGGLPIVLAKAQAAMWAELPKGDQVLTGPKALALARERKALADGDFGRSSNQGDIVLAALAFGRSEGPGALPQLLTALGKHTSSDLTATEVLTLAARMYVVDPDRIGHAVAQGPTGWSRDGQSIVRWNDKTRALFEDLADGNLAP